MLDTTFGASSGYMATDFSLATEAAYALARQVDGKFVAAGVSGGNFGIARFTAAGALDTTFNSTGKLTTDFGSSVDTAYGIVIGPNYKITAAGYTGAAPNGNFAVARYNVTSGLEERIYAQTDANHNVTSISDVFGSVLERFAYDPYGSFTVLNSGFTSTSDTKSWKYLHQGTRYDSIAGMDQFRNRDFSPTLGRWVQIDPMEYVDGLNQYEAFVSTPLSVEDPQGTNVKPFHIDYNPSTTAHYGGSLVNAIDRAMYKLGKELKGSFREGTLEYKQECNNGRPTVVLGKLHVSGLNKVLDLKAMAAYGISGESTVEVHSEGIIAQGDPGSKTSTLTVPIVWEQEISIPLRIRLKKREAETGEKGFKIELGQTAVTLEAQCPC